VGQARLDFRILGGEGGRLLFGFEGFGWLAVLEKSFGESIEDGGVRLRRGLYGVLG
jgi:hypothetical protein